VSNKILLNRLIDSMFSGMKNIKCIFAFLIMMVSTQVYALGEDSFKQGVSYFKSENYSNAVKQFESARKQGMKTPALYYNLGSAYFKIGNYDRAERYFMELKKVHKMKHLAEYNLGLIASKQKNTAKAKKYFKLVAMHSKDEKLVYLANQNLKKTKLVKTTKAPKKPWSVYLNGSLGYDNNINFAPVGIGTEESGTFFDALVSADYLFTGTRSSGFSGETSFYTIQYADTGNALIPKGAFDQDQVGFSFKKTQKLADWDTHVKVGFSSSTYGPRDYQSILNLELKGRRRLSKIDRFYLRYRYDDITSDDVTFDYLEGWKQRIKAEFRRYNKKSSAQLYYELELNDRADLVTGGGNELSFSPTRHTFRGKYTAALGQAWRLTGDLAYRKSDYPSTANQARNDDRWKAAVYANYRFDKTMKLKLKFEYTDNASTENVYVYDRQVISASLSKLF
jgi:tetratricopeptide (TPR) repeat protein